MSDETAMRRRAVDWFETSIVHPIEDFQDPKQEWRRLFSEVFGTFFLVLVAAGGGMMSQAFPNTISRTAAVTAPGLMVMAIILFMGKVSGAHLNPAVSLAFAARGDFPWKRVPGYIVVQLIGATLAALFLHAVMDVSAKYGSNYPGGLLEHVRVLDGAHPHPRTRERDPRYRVGGSEHRHHRRVRRRWVHRARRSVGQSDLGHVDEPGPHFRSRSRRPRLVCLLGVRRGTARRRRLAVARGFVLAVVVAARPVRAPRRETCRPRSLFPAKPELALYSSGWAVRRPVSTAAERGVVALVLVGVGLGERRERLVERVARAEVARRSRRVARAGVGPRQRPAAELARRPPVRPAPSSRRAPSPCRPTAGGCRSRARRRRCPVERIQPSMMSLAACISRWPSTTRWPWLANLLLPRNGSSTEASASLTCRNSGSSSSRPSISTIHARVPTLPTPTTLRAPST